MFSLSRIKKAFFFLYSDYYLTLRISFFNVYYDMSPQFALLPESAL